MGKYDYPYVNTNKDMFLMSSEYVTALSMA